MRPEQVKQPPSQRRPVATPVVDLLEMAMHLTPPEDVTFLAREVAWRIDSQEAARRDVKEVQKK
jgi:hypothetical protein